MSDLRTATRTAGSNARFDSGLGRIRAAGIERDVTFDTSEPNASEEMSAAYHAKYDRYGRSIVGTVVSNEAVRSTLRILPSDLK